ncbi:MAG: GGDEF domain-containing protein [Burkholderiales bacterium]|nr:GGDEF domain-containing protein [Burkholderiales bacterium]
MARFVGGLLASLLVAAASAQPADVLDRLQRLGEQRPQEALRALQALPLPPAATPPVGSAASSVAPAPTDGAVEHRRWVEGLLLIQAGRPEEAMQLYAKAGDDHPASLLLRAWAERRADRHQRADELARQAVAALPTCASCDRRLAYELQWLSALTHDALGDLSAAERAQQQALALAEQLGDTHRQARSLADLAQLQQARGDAEGAQQRLRRALDLPGLEPTSEAFVQLGKALVARAVGDSDGQRSALERALKLADPASRFANLVRVNLSDYWLHRGDAQQARSLAAAALSGAQGLNDAGLTRMARHNLVISLIQLRDLAQARLLSPLLQESGTELPPKEQLGMLNEQSKAWAQAGQWQEALRLLSLERELAAAFTQRQLEFVLAAQRQDQAAAQQQTELALLHEQQAVQEGQAANQRVLIWISLLAAVMLALALLVAGLLWAGSNAAQRRLHRSRRQLQDLAEFDALTGLRNRRALQDAMAARDAERSGEGGWMLIDIDHFKRINDSLGHASGDQVLQAVAQRLKAQVRDTDLLARWGGEEFLLHAPGAGQAALRQLAQRLLLSLSANPVQLDDGRQVQVSASIGFISLPLPRSSQVFDWERAVNWADMALYTAKNAGRNCAVGVLGANLDDARSLAQIEADFEGAAHAARVQLVQLRP